MERRQEWLVLPEHTVFLFKNIFPETVELWNSLR